MAEQSSGEKVFPATAHKRMEARKKGSVARSMDLSGACVFFAMIIALHATLSNGLIAGQLMTGLRTAFAFDPHPDGFDFNTAHLWHLKMLVWSGTILAPAFLLAVTTGIVINLAQVGFFLTPQALMPDFNKVNPATGLKRLFSARGGVETLKNIAKLGLIGWICWSVIQDNRADIIGAALQPLPAFASIVGGILWTLSIRVALTFLLIAVADYAFQKYDFEKSLKMTRDEMKQEVKQSDGDPLIKQRIRRKQREMAKARMMQEVPKATVVVTNPTHFAIALKYEAGMRAPVVVAKGQDELALTIKEIAREARVPMVENRPLAQALYKQVDLNREVPAEMYKAVAEVMAFVFRTQRRRR